jgi:hypothetical protein
LDCLNKLKPPLSIRLGQFIIISDYSKSHSLTEYQYGNSDLDFYLNNLNDTLPLGNSAQAVYFRLQVVDYIVFVANLTLE